MSQIVIVNTRPEHIPALVLHQQTCFPTLDPGSWMRAEHFAAHLDRFPAGQHVALDGERVVGQSSTFRVSGQRAMDQHGFLEITHDLTFAGHDLCGEWLYGADMSVHPDYRGRRISKMLYDARKDLVRNLQIDGIVAGGQLADYFTVRATVRLEDYIARVVAGDLVDATLTPQLRSGFGVRGILWRYLDDSEHGEEATLLVWQPDKVTG